MRIQASQGSLARAARWVRAHRRLVIAGWLAAVLLVMAAAHQAGTRYTNNLALPGTESQRATDLLRRQIPSQAGDADQIVLHVRAGTIADPAVRASVTQVLGRVERLPHVSGVVSPYSRQGAVCARQGMRARTQGLRRLPGVGRPNGAVPGPRR